MKLVALMIICVLPFTSTAIGVAQEVASARPFSQIV